jgi:hypothetical protein
VAGFKDPATRHAEPGVRALPPGYALTRESAAPELFIAIVTRCSWGPGAPAGLRSNLRCLSAYASSDSQREASAPTRLSRGPRPVGQRPRQQLPPEPRHDNASAHTSSRAVCHEARPKRQGRPGRPRPLAIAFAYNARSPSRDRRPPRRERVAPLAGTSAPRTSPAADVDVIGISLAVNDRQPASPPPGRGSVPGHLVIAH